MSDMAHSLTWGRDEAELVTELQAGSDAAFEWLVTYYHASVYNLVYGILSDAADAADVTQEVFSASVSRDTRIPARQFAEDVAVSHFGARSVEPPAMVLAASPAANFD